VPDGLELIRAIFDRSARTCADALRALRKRCGLPDGLRAEGIAKADIPRLADKAIEDACWRSNPRQPVTKSDLVALYEASM
jgi:alcohol dehydrogenase